MRLVLLTRGKIALVDDDDYNCVTQYMWQAHPGRNTWYATGRIYGPGNPLGTAVSMHRFLLGMTDSAIPVDHINRNGLDNRRGNLRIVTPAQNCWNSPAHKDAFSEIKGVSFDATSIRRKRWTAYIMRNGRRKRLGYFYTEQEAALAYSKAERNFQTFEDFA